MNDIAIQVECLSKKYCISRQQENYRTLRDTLTDTLVAPFRRAAKLLRGDSKADVELEETITALNDITFRVKRGEVIGIIGRNGAGKTTLLRILSRITKPSEGYADIQGRVGTLLEVGTGFHPELTGRENTYMNGAILGMKKQEIDRKFKDIIAFAEIEKFIDTPVKHYSAGMSVRLAFAVAAHLEPEILLVDEVLAVGDAEFQKKCLGVMDTLGCAGRTVLLVSHNMAAIENLCSRAIWIDRGKIRQDGDAREVTKAYLSAFAGANQTNTDLSHIQTRRGIGEARYTKIEILSIDRTPKKLIRSGDNLIFRLHYCAKERIPNPRFGLQIYTQLGTLVTEVSTWGTGVKIPILPPGDGYIDLQIEFLNLMPGRYYGSLWLKGPGPTHYDVLDHCVMFDVEASNFYRSGRGISSRLGIIFLPCKWRFDGLEGGKDASDYRDKEQRNNGIALEGEPAEGESEQSRL